MNAIVVDEDLMTDELAKGSPPFSAAIGPSRNVLQGGWTEAHRHLVQQWLSSCTLHHRICPTADGRPLPTRVVSVGRTGKDLRLHISNGEQGEYVALSHSWGGHKPRETTKATLHQHCESIHLDESSKTFDDAAKVCRDLGYKYLWIDSLCIVQDDGADWAAEAALSATASVDWTQERRTSASSKSPRIPIYLAKLSPGKCTSSGQTWWLILHIES